MFKEIELAQLRNPELSYNSLINTLNDLLDHYRTLINMRGTIHKRRAAGSEVEDDEEDDSTTPPTDGETPAEPDENDDPIEGEE